MTYLPRVTSLIRKTNFHIPHHLVVACFSKSKNKKTYLAPLCVFLKKTKGSCILHNMLGILLISVFIVGHRAET